MESVTSVVLNWDNLDSPKKLMNWQTFALLQLVRGELLTSSSRETDMMLNSVESGTHSHQLPLWSAAGIQETKGISYHFISQKNLFLYLLANPTIFFIIQ